MFKLLKMIVFILLSAYLILCSAVFYFQRSLIYHPTPDLPVNPSNILTLSVDDVKLKISVRDVVGNNAILYFGGNAETVSNSLPKYAAAFPDHAIYMLHYRGFSGSTGAPSEAALHIDAEKLYEYVKAKHNKITVIGRSLGSGIAIRLAATRPLNKLVLVTPYDSMLNMARLRFPYLPVSLLLKDHYESWRYAPQIIVPTIILTADKDQVIPIENSRKLFKSFYAGVADFKVINNTDHYSISLSPEYFPLMQ